MPDTSSTAESQNTAENQAAGNNSSGAPTPNQQQGGSAAEQSTQSNNQSHMIPKSRFDEVNTKYKALEAQIQELTAKNEEYRQANLSDEEKRKEELEALRTKASSVESLQETLEKERAFIEQVSKQYLEQMPEATREKVKAYAKAKGIEEADSRALYQEALALQTAGLLDVQQSARPQPPATHAGRPGASNGVNGLDPGSRDGAKSALASLLSRR